MDINFNDPVKQEIWEVVRAVNEAWTKGNPEDLVRFFHKNMVAITPTSRNRLDGGAACVTCWKNLANEARIHHWEELDPVIHLYGQSAVVAYNFDMMFDMGGETIHLGGRDMFFFVKEKGQWWVVADQYSSFPP